MKNKSVQNIIIVFCSVLFALYLIDGIIIVMDRLNFGEDLRLKRIERAKKLGIPFDERSRETVVNDLRSRGIEAYPVLDPYSLLRVNLERNFLPLGTISQKVIVQDNESGVFETWTSDEHGFHNPPGAWDEGRTEILILGDSFAMGGCVQDGADIRSQLASYGRKVITLGLDGNDALLELAGLCEYGKYFKPNIVLWLYFEGNDLSEQSTHKKCAMLREYLNDNFTQDLLHRQNEIDQEYITFYEQMLKQKERDRSLSGKFSRYIFKFITLNHLRNKLELLWSQEEAELPLFATILRKANNLTASMGGKLYFVYLPDYNRYSLKKDDKFHCRNQVIEIVKKLNIPIIDFHETMKKQKDPLDLFPYGFRVGVHYTEAGYSLLAATIMSGLKKNIAAGYRGN